MFEPCDVPEAGLRAVFAKAERDHLLNWLADEYNLTPAGAGLTAGLLAELYARGFGTHKLECWFCVPGRRG